MQSLSKWCEERIDKAQIAKYLEKGDTGFFPHTNIEEILSQAPPKEDEVFLDDILNKSLAVETLSLEEVFYLMNIKSEDLWEKIYDVAGKVKKKVYDNRIVTFAPLYLSNYCVNNCLYCGFRRDNEVVVRRRLSFEELEKEVEVLAGEIGHKRLIVVYGEHPVSDIEYIAQTIEKIYSVKVKTRKGYGSIRRVNVNAPPMKIEELRRLKEVGIGTYQVFQETYHLPTYLKVHPEGTIKHNYLWRLYVMHRAMEAGIDDVGIGVLFGLYDWRFEVLGLVAHSIELEREFGIGPHTISFPRIEPAVNTPFVEETKYKVDDDTFKKLVAILRLAVPYTGMIITAREPQRIRDDFFKIGITQTDASTKIGIGAYSERLSRQEIERQQFVIGDMRSLEELIRDLAKMGYITSFCTAGYRCGRTGKKIMDLLRCGREGQFCKLNAILTFKEWIDDFASDETKAIAEELLRKEMEEVKENLPKFYPQLVEFYERIDKGERDLYF